MSPCAWRQVLLLIAMMFLKMTSNIRQTLLIDADDTLWENNVYFERAIAKFIAHLNHREYTAEQVREILNEVAQVLDPVPDRRLGQERQLVGEPHDFLRLIGQPPMDDGRPPIGGRSASRPGVTAGKR